MFSHQPNPMKHLSPLVAAALVLLTGGCVAAESSYYVERPVPVTVAPTAPMAPEAPLAPSAIATPVANAPGTMATTVATGSVATASVQPLDQLVAPVALYPDPLLGLLLPASTMSSDIVLAARYLAGGGDPQQVDAQPWDESVRGLAHYPEVVKWMDENLAWTQQLGAAYLDNPENVMAAVQRVRTEARAKGLLTDTAQQQVFVEDSTIAIVPAQPEVIYVPRYDPEIIFVDRPVIYATDPWLTFGAGFGIGWWLSYDCDWHHRRIWIDRHARDHWRERPVWRQPHYVGGGGAARPGFEPWRPSPNRPRTPRHDFDHDRRPTPRPAPMPGTPHRDRPRHGGDDHRDNRPNNPRHDAPQRPTVTAPSSGQTPTTVRHMRPIGSDGRVITPQTPPGAPSEPRQERDRGRDRPQRDNPSSPSRPTPTVNQAPASQPPAVRPAPRPDTPARVAPAAPRERQEPRTDQRVERSPRAEPAPRVAPPARTDSDNSNRSRGDTRDQPRDRNPDR